MTANDKPVRTRVKVCCISSSEEAALAIAAGADALGLVTDMPSGPGIITDEEARQIAAGVPAPIATFLLTSLSEPDAIVEQATRCGCNTLQLVRHLDPECLAVVRSRLPSTQLVQVIHIEGDSAFELLETYTAEPRVRPDNFLLDSGKPGGEGETLGGTGQTHDWAISAEFVARSPIPVFLAGGLNPDNVGLAVRQVQPFGLDLCSGVRANDGLDSGLLNAFMAAVRQADQSSAWRRSRRSSAMT